VYKNIKCAKIKDKVFEEYAGTGNLVSIRTACVSKKIKNLVVFGADNIIKDGKTYSGGVWISLDGGQTYDLYDRDTEGTAVADMKIGGICSIREEQNFDRSYPDVTGYEKATAFICGNNNGELFEMIVYLDADGSLHAGYAHALYYISGRYVCSSYNDLVRNNLSISNGLGTIFDFDFIDGKYVIAASTGIWAYYVDDSRSIKVVKTYDNCAAYSALKYNDKVYVSPVPTVSGTPRYMISTANGIDWSQEY